MAQASATPQSARVLPRGLMRSVKQVIPTLSYPAATPAEIQLQGGIPIDLPLIGLIVDLKYRANVTTLATSVNADAPLSLIQYIRVQGAHKRRGAVTVIGNCSLADLDAYNRRQGYGARNLGQALAVGVGTYDVWAQAFIPLSLPQLNQPHDQALSMLNGPDWNSLDFFASFGGFADLYTGGAGTILGYGGTGSAQLSISRVVGKLGGGVQTFAPFIVQRTQTLAPNSALATGGVGIQIYPNLATGPAYYDLFLKTFVQAAGAGTVCAKTLLDGTALTRVLVQVGTNPVVIAPWADLQYAAEQSLFGGVPAQAHIPGYALQDWGQGDQEAAFPTQLFNAASQQFGLYGDVTVVANSLLAFISTLILPS